MLDKSFYDKADEIIALHGATSSALIPIIYWRRTIWTSCGEQGSM